MFLEPFRIKYSSLPYSYYNTFVFIGCKNGVWSYTVKQQSKLTYAEFDVCLSVHRFMRVEKKNQLDGTEWFIALIICSTCFGHLYDHHQKLQTILVLLPHMVCNALVAGGRRSGAGQQAMCPGWGKLPEQFPSSFYVWRTRTNGNHSLCCLLSKAWRCTDNPEWEAVVCWLLHRLACAAAGIVC